MGRLAFSRRYVTRQIEQEAAMATRSSVRLQATLFGLAVVLIGILVGMLFSGGQNRDDSSTPEQPEHQQFSRPPAPAPAVDVVMTFDQASWLEVVVDGIAVEQGVLVAAGETLQFRGQQTVALRLGNAGAVQIKVNGDDLGLAGAAGQLVRVTYGPEGRRASDG